MPHWLCKFMGRPSTNLGVNASSILDPRPLWGCSGISALELDLQYMVVDMALTFIEFTVHCRWLAKTKPSKQTRKPKYTPYYSYNL